MTGKNVKDRIGPGGMDADRIREIMGEAPACPRKGRGTSGNDIMRPARKSGPMQPSVYGEEYPQCHAPETVHPGGSLEKWNGHAGGVHQPPCIAASGRIQGNGGDNSGRVPAQPVIIVFNI